MRIKLISSILISGKLICVLTRKPDLMDEWKDVAGELKLKKIRVDYVDGFNPMVFLFFIDELATVVASLPQLPRLSSQIVLDELWDVLGKILSQ